MSATAENTLEQNPVKTAAVALKTFFNIAKKWGANTEQCMALLGQPGRSTFFKWKRGDVSSLQQDTLERISYVLGIYKGLGLLFPKRKQADEWVKKPNQAFNGDSALEYMTKGKMLHLFEMRKYIDAQRG